MPVEQPTDFNGVVYAAAADTDLCEIVWIDSPPLDQDELRSLLDRAANALDAAAAPLSSHHAAAASSSPGPDTSNGDQLNATASFRP